MTSSTASALRHPQNLADLLDGRPDTRELISGNLNLAHACLLLKQGEPAEAEHALELAQQSESPGLSTISRCIRAEVLRVNGRLAEAWDLAEELSKENRFDTVASLYLRFLFPHRPKSEGHPVAPHSPPTTESVPHGEDAALAVVHELSAPQPPVEEPRLEPSPASVVEPLSHDSDSEVSMALENDHEEEVEAEIHGELPGVLGKIAMDSSIRLLRLHQPDGIVAEVQRSHTPFGDIESALMKRPLEILASFGFGGLTHASFEGPQGAAHAWARSGRVLVLIVEGSTTAPALAARCSRAMEEK